MFGQSLFNPPSRFLGEIPSHLVESIKTDREQGPPGQSPNGFGHEPLAVSAGDTVFHERWGEGVVVEVSGTGRRAEATVAFEDVGEKRLLLAYAPLARD